MKQEYRIREIQKTERSFHILKQTVYANGIYEYCSRTVVRGPSISFMAPRRSPDRNCPLVGRRIWKPALADPWQACHHPESEPPSRPAASGEGNILEPDQHLVFRGRHSGRHSLALRLAFVADGCVSFVLYSGERDPCGRAQKRYGEWKADRFLQKTGILQGKQSHDWHHTAPYDANFCVMTEFLNPVLNRVRFWERMEWLILKILRVPVLRGSDIRGGI